MFVSRSEVSFCDSIQRESCVTGEKAIASSDDGKGLSSDVDLTNVCSKRATVTSGIMGFHKVAGPSVAAIETFRGPVRRSRYGASDVRHESAACCRSVSVMVTCINFSASAKVAGETGGPLPAPVPKVGGALGVFGVGCEPVDDNLWQAVVATSTASGACTRNCRRVFMGEETNEIGERGKGKKD